MARRHEKSDVLRAQLDCEGLIRKAVAAKNVRLKLFVQDEDWLAIEGDRKSLAFLGKLLQSFAKDEGPGCLILDSPETAVFQSGSLGIYVYRQTQPGEPERRRTKRST